MARSRLIVANRVILALFAIVLVAASGVAAYEIAFTAPPCRAGDCGAREAHFAGSRLVGAAMLGLWVYLLLWIMLTRICERRGTPGPLPLFWIGPLAIAYMLDVVLT